MQFKARDVQDKEFASVREQAQMVLKGLGYSLIELVISRHRGSAQVKAVIYSKAGISTDDCSKAHRALIPRLELAFDEKAGSEKSAFRPEIYLEVSSPGIDRCIKNAEEFIHYTGRTVRCYRIDISDWTIGVLESADENGITIKINEGNKDILQSLSFDIIAKARLDPS
ncbi:MAG: ribosome assembly cofactor RimP [Treponema sp.]|nr:ribosome assembly cofactor RimP [Treponema sp.]